jgi:conjugal transfer pilin signal peptidase TrbI
MNLLLRWSNRRLRDAAGLVREFKRRGYALAALVLAFAWLYQRLLIPSLPHTLVYLQKGVPVGRGDYVVYRVAGRDFDAHFEGQWLFKRVAGVAGDRVTVAGRDVFVNGEHAGFARFRTESGIPLEPVEPTVIPGGQFYVKGTHAQSFDSRYRASGLVRAEQIVGRAIVLF